VSTTPVRVLSLEVTSADVHGYNRATMTDASFVRAVLEGNATAFTTLVDRHARVCLRFATRMLGNIEDAEDVTQETFVRAYGALGRYDERVAFQTWIMSILINRCRTSLQSRRRRDARVVSDDGAVAIAAVAPDYNSDIRDAIERALAKLEPGQREAFLLKHVEQLSYEEMSAMTGAGVSALKMRVQRACERLQELLEEDRHG
jgi:RNA polymerase sigma-70 factor, ECF subfamily